MPGQPTGITSAAQVRSWNGQTRKSSPVRAMSGLPLEAAEKRTYQYRRSGPIVLQKSKVAAALVFGENLKREDIDDSRSLSRATEVAYEFSARR